MIEEMQQALLLHIQKNTFNSIEDLEFYQQEIHKLMKTTNVDDAFRQEQQKIDEEVKKIKDIGLAIDSQQKLAETLENNDIKKIACAQEKLNAIMAKIPYQYGLLWRKFETLTNQCLRKDGSVEKNSSKNIVITI